MSSGSSVPFPPRPPKTPSLLKLLSPFAFPHSASSAFSKMIASLFGELHTECIRLAKIRCIGMWNDTGCLLTMYSHPTGAISSSSGVNFLIAAASSCAVDEDVELALHPGLASAMYQFISFCRTTASQSRSALHKGTSAQFTASIAFTRFSSVTIMDELAEWMSDSNTSELPHRWFSCCTCSPSSLILTCGLAHWMIFQISSHPFHSTLRKAWRANSSSTTSWWSSTNRRSCVHWK
mmetsp:Transcript_6117/g.15140  ORF Transcript_6117/g.15140 Transcript_6117/m.15140 type:complete len:236 (-) Transcript_6117:2001-2708(-)